MTPLDCALQRGFRTTAKFLQLHGGVPANKLANPQKTENVTSSANLNIRDDVTVVGDTSDDEKEINELPGADRKKRSYKKKHRKEKEDVGKRSRMVKTKGTTSEDVWRYSSEVIMSDDKNETMNIEQSGEIVISERQKEKSTFGKSKIPLAATEAKEKRPKSAKHTKVASRNKTTSSPEKETKNTSSKSSEELEKQTFTATSTQESADTKTSVETVVKQTTPKTQKILEEVVPNIDSLKPPENQSKEDADKQSLLSSTSVDEGQKEVIVEAHVHSPPKSLDQNLDQQKSEDGKTTESKKDAKSAEQSMETKTPKNSKGNQDATEVPMENEDVYVEKTEELLQAESGKEIAAEETTDESKAPKPKKLSKEKTIGNETELTVETKEITEETKGEVAKSEKQETEDVVKENIDAGIIKIESSSGEKSKRLTKQTTISKDPETLKGIVDTIETKVDGVKSIVEESITAAKEEVKQEVFSTEQKLEDVATAVETTISEVNQEVDIGVKEAEQDVAIEVGIEKQGLVDAVKTTEAEVGKVEEVLQSKKSKTSSSKKEIALRRTRAIGNEKIETLKSAKTKKTKPPTTTDERKKKQFLKPTPHKHEYDASAEMKSSEDESTSPSSSSKDIKKEHKSFKVLDDLEELAVKRVRSKSQGRKAKSKPTFTKERSKSEESNREHISERYKRSKIPTPIKDLKRYLSKSDRHLGHSNQIPILRDLHQDSKNLRSESSMTAPIHASTYSDDDGSDIEEILSSATRRKRLRKRTKARESKSAGSDYESSNLIDSGFEPSPRSSRLPKWKNVSERGVDMTSVTQTIQTNIRR